MNSDREYTDHRKIKGTGRTGTGRTGAGWTGAAENVRCPYCGAEYEKGLLHCPYCGAVDDHQDESEFLEDLDKLKDKLEDLPEETLRQTNRLQTREAVRDLRRIMKIAGIILGVFLLIFGAVFFYDRTAGYNNPERRKEESRKKYLWMQENIPLLDEMYEKGDYEGLLDAYTYDGDSWYYEWAHYDLLEGLRLLQRVREHDIPFLEESEKTFGADSRQASEDRAVLLADELQILYFDKRAKNEEDIETIRSMSGDVLDDLSSRFALSEEELSYFERLINENYGYLSISDCRKFLDKRQKSR